MIFVCVCGFDLISVVVHYISVVIFLMENSSNSTTTTTITTSNPGTTTHDSILDNGPNNASCVVWAHSEFFNFSFHVFFHTKHYGQLPLIYWSYGGAQGRWRQGERAQTMGFMLFGPFSEFFFLFSSCFLYTKYHWEATEAMIVRRDCQHTIKRKMGTNDTKCVIWAISTCFFFLYKFISTRL